MTTKFIQKSPGAKIHLSDQAEPAWSLCGRAGNLVGIEGPPIDVCQICWQRIESNPVLPILDNKLKRMIGNNSTRPKRHAYIFSLWVADAKLFWTIGDWTLLDHQIFEIVAADVFTDKAAEDRFLG